MKILQGIIKKIYLPDEFIDEKPVDELYRKNIGFFIKIGEKTYKYETLQNVSNCKFFLEEKVGVCVENGKIIELRKLK